MKCGVCSHETGSNVPYCPHCGSLLSPKYLRQRAPKPKIKRGIYFRLLGVLAAALVGAFAGYEVLNYIPKFREDRPYASLGGAILGAALIYTVSTLKIMYLNRTYRERLRELSEKVDSKMESAEERYTEAQKLGESLPIVKSRLATLHLVKNETMRSVDEFRQAEAIGAASPAFYNNFGVALARTGNRIQAVSALEKAAAKLGQQIEPYVNLAHAAVNLEAHSNGSASKSAFSHIEKARELNGDSFEMLEREGLLLLHDGKYEEAKLEFNRALEQAGEKRKQADVRNHLGIDYLMEGQLRDAADEFRAALALDPGHAKAQCNLGLLALLQKRNTAGLEALLQANQLEPKNGVILNNLGYGLCTTGAVNEGIASLKESTTVDVSLWEPFYNLGKLYTDEMHFDPAQKHLEHVLDVRPTTWEAMVALGVTKIKTGEHFGAAELLRKAYEIAPHEPTVLTNLGIALAFVFEYEEAERLLRIALQDSQDDPLPWARLAWMHVMQGIPRLAAEELLTAIKLAPRDPVYNNYYGLVNIDMGSVDVAMIYFRRALSIKPDYGAVHYHVGYVHLIRKRLPDAIKAWEHTIVAEPEFADGFVNIGVAYYEQGDLEQAATNFRRALVLRQNRVEDYSNLALTYSKQGVALKKDSKNPFLGDFAAKLAGSERKAKAAMEKFQLAVDMFDKALAMEPENVVLHSNRGLACWYAERVEEAAAEWTTVAHLDPEYAARRGHLMRSAFDETSLAYMPLRISDRMFGFPLATPGFRFRIAPGYDADRWGLIIEDEEIADVPAMADEIGYIERNLRGLHV